MHLRALSLVLALFVPALAADAQPAPKVYRIGYLSLQAADVDKHWVAAFRQGLRDHGYVEGENLTIEQRHAARRPERMPTLAAELVGLQIDVLVVFGAYSIVGNVPTTMPIVFIAHPDPVADGLVASLARPGGNFTGLSDAHADLVAKRLQLLKDVLPAISRVAVLFNPRSPIASPQLKLAQSTAPALGMTAVPVEIDGSTPADLERAFANMRKERLGAFLVIAEPLVASHRKQIVAFAVKNRLPTIGTHKGWADDGFLMSYGADFHDLWRRAAAYAAKILKGAKVGDLPVEQPTKFELVINMNTAKALGLTIPMSLRLQADHVIEDR
jgi:putative ABC transport system substrate-binding protein